jgi:hypothetical protein
LEILTMSTALRSSARVASSTPRDPDVTAAINARRNRGVKSVVSTPLSPKAAPVVIDVPTNTPAEVVVAKALKTSAKAKARKAAADRAGTIALDPATGATVLTPKAKKAPKVAKQAKAPKVAKAPAPKRPKLTGYDKRQDGTLSARDLTCLCGCGSSTVTNDARFISGHDAKMRQTILTSSDDASEQANAIPAIVRPFFDNGETVAGLRLRGSKVVDVKATKRSSDSDDAE